MLPKHSPHALPVSDSGDSCFFCYTQDRFYLNERTVFTDLTTNPFIPRTVFSGPFLPGPFLPGPFLPGPFLPRPEILPKINAFNQNYLRKQELVYFCAM